MNTDCARVRELMHGFIDRDLTPEEIDQVESHLEGCQACEAEAAALRDVVGSLARLPRDITPDTDLWPAIARQLTPAKVVSLETRHGSMRTGIAAWLGLGRRQLAWGASALALAVLALVVGRAVWDGRQTPWEIDRLEGAPLVGDKDLTAARPLRRGDWVRTDASSRARVSAPDVGRVDIGPGTEVRLLTSQSREHRIELAQGKLSAFIWAPPRLFFVETPAGVAEDLGCQYDLVVDRAGNGTLEVSLGFVSFERDGHEVIVPQGARCDLHVGRGPGTPHVHTATATLRRALARFDAAELGSAAVLDPVLELVSASDAVTLWHLLPRVSETERPRVVDRLAAFVPPPEGVTRAGAAALDARMLGAWWSAIYPDWTLWN